MALIMGLGGRSDHIASDAPSMEAPWLIDFIINSDGLRGGGSRAAAAMGMVALEPMVDCRPNPRQWLHDAV